MTTQSVPRIAVNTDMLKEYVPKAAPYTPAELNAMLAHRDAYAGGAIGRSAVESGHVIAERLIATLKEERNACADQTYAT